MRSEKITFDGHSGAPLAARLDLPAGPVRAAAILAHCFTCSKDIAAARRISGRLAALGIAVFRFDFTGLGHSGGEFANTTFSSNVADLKAAFSHMQSRGLPVQRLIGHSLGGAAVIKAAPDLAGLHAVVGRSSEPNFMRQAGQENPTARFQTKRVHFAPQGGGVHGAFFWGVPGRILKDGRPDIAVVSGTSAGAMNAVVPADGFAAGGPDKVREKLEQFWRSITEAIRWSAGDD